MNDDLIFTTSDFKRLFFRHRRTILKGTLITALFVFLFLLTRPPTYLAEASFKQGSAKVEQNFDWKSLLRMTSMQDSESSAISLMLSQKLLHRTVEEMGWQLSVPTDGLWKKIIDNIRTEAGLPFHTPTFAFAKAHYAGEKTLTYGLRFVDEKTYEVLDKNNNRLALAHVGDAVSFENISFTLCSCPENLKIGKTYNLLAHPWQPVVAWAKKLFSIKPTPLDKSVLSLKFPHRSKEEGARFLNTLMQVYQNYLKEENQAITDAQLKYLERRQDELNFKLDRTLEEHVSYLKKNLGEKGFVDLEQEIETVSKPREDYLQKLFDVEFELGRLKNISFPAKNEEFRGIDSHTARNLYLQYTRELDSLEATLKQLLFLQNQMTDPHLDISSLGSILTDSVTQEMIRSASTLELELHDEANRSDKEHLRLREALDTKRRFISSHLAQSIDLHQIRIALIKEKLTSLEHVMVDLLRTEKKLIEERLSEMGNRMSDWPEKWSLDKKFKLRAELTKGMMEGLTQIFESKTLNRHLFHVESRPIDVATAPLRPQSSHLLLFLLGATFCTALLIYLYFLFQALRRAVPLSIQTLQAMGEHVSGEISSSLLKPFEDCNDSDLETLRKAAQFLLDRREKLCVCLPCLQIDFSKSLAHLLHMQSKKSLIIHADFDKVATLTDMPGLWHFLTGSAETPPIRHTASYDYIPAGARDRFAEEMLSHKFEALLLALREKYDFIFLIGPPSLLTFSDVGIVTLDPENVPAWGEIQSWNRQKNSSCVTFIQLAISEVI
ncbi:MAG: hypothetical protein JSR58_03565 [Verrucomicrobia bacterium]|nr:hypothetical protein [Verrucomicrobiota bacterium]